MLSRVWAIAESQAIDISPMRPMLEAMAGRGAPRVSLHSEFSRLSIGTAWPAGDRDLALARHRLDSLGPGFAAQRAWLPALLADESRAARIEVESIPSRPAVAFVARSTGERDVSDDLRYLRDHGGVEANTVRQLEGLVALLGGLPCRSLADRCAPPALHTWTLEFAMPWNQPAERAAAIAAAEAIARVFGLSAAQRRVAAEVHAFLLGASACTLSLVTCRDEVLPYAELEYCQLHARTVVRVLTGLYPEQRCPMRLGALVAGAGATSIAALRLRLGDAGGIRSRVAVDLSETT